MKRVVSFLLISVLLAASLCGCKSREEREWEEQIRQYRAAKMEIYAEENEKYDDYEVDVAFIGDSLTDMYDVKAYYPDYLVSNRGIGGDTTFDLEGRIEQSLYELKPKVAVILIGTNNFHSMFENYESILIGIKENLPNTKIILLSLTSMSGEWGKNNQVAAYNNVKIKMLAQKYSFEYVDLYSPLLNLETGEIYPEYTIDGCHFTADGYEVITAKVTPTVKEQLAAWHTENPKH